MKTYRRPLNIAWNNVLFGLNFEEMHENWSKNKFWWWYKSAAISSYNDIIWTYHQCWPEFMIPTFDFSECPTIKHKQL